MKITLICLVGILVGLQVKASAPVNHRLEKYGVTLRLADVYKIQAMKLDPEDLRRLDFQDDSLRRPVLTAAGPDTNALRIECPSGPYAILFAFDDRFPSIDAYYNTIDEARKNVAKLSGAKVDDVYQCMKLAALLNSVNATEISVRRHSPSNDHNDLHNFDVFSELILLQVGQRTYGIIMRSYATAAPTTNGAERLILQTICDAISLDTVQKSLMKVETPRPGFRLMMPSFWNSVRYMRSDNPLSKLSGTDTEPKDGGTEVQVSDSSWNTVIVREPLFQLRISVHPISMSSPDSVRNAIHESLASIASRYEHDVTVSDDVQIGPHTGSQVTYLHLRRGKVLHRYFVTSRKGWVMVSEVTCWQHDYPTAIRAIDAVISSMQWKE